MHVFLSLALALFFSMETEFGGLDIFTVMDAKLPTHQVRIPHMSRYKCRKHVKLTCIESCCYLVVQIVDLNRGYICAKYMYVNIFLLDSHH